MAPRIILVMRHAEKPDDPHDVHLSPEGYARADKLASYVPQTFGAPDHIYATADGKHSHRPVETVEPLAKALGKTVHADIKDDDYAALADKLLNDHKTDGALVLVCWHHETIPGLLQSLGAPADGYPEPWPGDVFDLVVRMEFGADAPAVSTVTEPF